MSISIDLIPIKKNRLSLSTERLRRRFGRDTLYIIAIRLHRLVIFTRLNSDQALEAAAATISTKFDAKPQLNPEIYTLNGTAVTLSKKWLEEAGWKEGDLAFSIDSSTDPSTIAIEFLSAEELLISSVKRWLNPEQSMPDAQV